jgi:hypothetical protein
MREQASRAARAFLSAWVPLLVAGILLPVAACSRGTRTKTVVETVTQTVTQTVTETVTVEKDSPYENLWATSGHADATAEAFNHWNADGEVSKSCAKCHSTPGFQDFLGADGSAFGTVDQPAPIGTVINCEACHNAVTPTIDSVTFPSGAVVTGLDASARCMLCHQGRSSTPQVNDKIASAAAATDDTVSDSLSFQNVHYFAAGATLYGGDAMGAYQYDGMYYDREFPHVAAYDSCIACHDQHSLKVRVEKCGQCHNGVSTEADLKNIRMAGSVADYDGDGNTTEGISGELSTLADILYGAIQQYCANVLASPIVYNPDSYPYFFEDTNGNGVQDVDETTGYAAWTPRLVRATYNYQFYIKDPGAFAHNAKYLIEVLYDSIADLNSVDGVDVTNFDKLVRDDSGHFDGPGAPFRHWDSGGEVEADCARCHSIEGFDFHAEYGIDIPVAVETTDGFSCETCHVKGTSFATDPARKYVAEVTFPSDVTIENDPNNPDDSFICMTCHQGRESKKTVDERIATGKYAFRNIHYLAAGATLYGGDAHVGYEYDGKTYAGKWGHFNKDAPAASQCTFCHLKDHTFLPQIGENCKGCHVEVKGDAIETIRLNRNIDYNGNGSTTENLEDEVASYAERLLTAMQDYCTAHSLPKITYNGDAYPYWYTDTGAQFKSWDPTLMKATFNYQYWSKEPGAWAHNTNYILELLYDSIVDLGGDTDGLIRP